MNETKKEDLILKGLLGILILSSFTSGIKLGSESYGLSLSQIFAFLLFAWLFIGSATNRLQIPVFFTDYTSLFIYLYFLTNLVSSILISPNKPQSLKGCLSIFTYVVIYTTMRWVMKFMIDYVSVINRLMKFNAISAFFGLGCMVVAFLTGSENIGTSYGQLGTAGIQALQSPVPSIKSLAIEPNMFAITTATVLCINLSVYLLWRKSTAQISTILLLSIAILFAYTRSVYIGVAAAVLFLIVLSKRIKLLISLTNYFVALLLICVALIVILPDTSGIKIALKGRVSTLTDFTSGSGLGRVQGYRIGMNGLSESPLIGNGTFSAKTRIFNIYANEYQEQFGGPGWLTGTWIQSLHDTGIIGFMIVLGLFGSILLANFRIFKQISNTAIEKSMILGFIGGNIVIIVSSLLSSPLWISFPYIFWAINMAFIAKCKRETDDKATN